MSYSSFIVQRELTFTINQGDVFIIMGCSGCGKSTLLRHMISLKPQASGRTLQPGARRGDDPAGEVSPANGFHRRRLRF